MSVDNLIEVLRDIRASDVTKTIHPKSYDAISPTRPELNQAGKIVLITGGGTGAGFAIAKAFVSASAATVIICGRRAEVLETARTKLEDEAKSKGTDTKIIARPCDIAKDSDVDALWQFFSDQKLIIDVYVANAAAFCEPKPMMEMGADAVWSMFETNVKSPLYFTEKFCKQPDEKQKFIVNVTTVNIHATNNPVVATFPAYTLTKLAGTVFFQYLSQETPADKIQVVSFHPGVIPNDVWKAMGIGAEHCDDDDLPGSFAVWAASKEAAFLHGRTVWASWDVQELATGELRRRIDEDFYFLKTSVVGLDGPKMTRLA